MSPVKKTSSSRKQSLHAAAESEQQLEARLWPSIQPGAEDSVRFWNIFFALRSGSNALTISQVQRLIDLVRAVCWVETKHGTYAGGASRGLVDVMQCADLRNPWWKELITRSSGSDRFVGGPGRSSWWADQLPAAAAADPLFDQAAAITTLTRPAAGSSDSNFSPIHSLYWGVPLLLEKMNGAAGSRTYQCGDLDRSRLLAGARAYNGGGDSLYERKVDAALKLFGGAPLVLQAAADSLPNLLNEAGHAPKPPVLSKPSPNHASRQGNIIQYLILHNTDGSLKSALARLTDPTQSVSAHYVVDRTGDIYQLVQDSETAWHAGNKPINQQSIGMEVVAWKTAQGMTAAQESALAKLARFVVDAYDIPLKNVLPHRRVRIGGTDCPGWVWPTDAELDAWTSQNLNLVSG